MTGRPANHLALTSAALAEPPSLAEPAASGTPAALAPPAVLRAVGHTPLVEICHARAIAPRARIFAKLESVNPGGSIKDRPVARMLTAALHDGRLGSGKRLLDSSSGNAGISYALFGAALGVPVTLVVPGNASRERLDRMRAHGAELILTDPLKGYDFAVHEARRLATAHPERYWYCDQYSNPENWRAHYSDTAGELLADLANTCGRLPDAFVAGVGTGGTLTGIGRRLREANPQLLIAAVLPDRFPGIEGLKPLGQPDDFVPPNYDASLVDRFVPVSIEDAIATCRELAAEGLFVGTSAGALVRAASLVAADGDRHCVVTVLPDTGERYVSTGMWSA